MAWSLAFDEIDFEEGAVKVITLENVEVGVFRHNGGYLAYRNICPHQGGPVCEGILMHQVEMELDEERKFRKSVFNTNKTHFVCPWHGWEFDLETGEAIGDRNISVKRYGVLVEDGKVYVDVQ